MKTNPYESPKQASPKEAKEAAPPAAATEEEGGWQMWSGIIFFVIVVGAFGLAATADNWRATIVISLFPLPVGAVTLIFCRRWGLVFWGLAALLEALNLYATAMGWMESGFSW